MAHGIMFHHFHSEFHAPRPGSISGEDFEQMLDFLASEFRIVGPEEFARLSDAERRSDRVVVLTFDDALLSQVDVAAPILRERGYGAVFSVYSSVFGGQPDPLEVFASFRAEAFPDFSSFWDAFEREARRKESLGQLQFPRHYPEDYLSDFPFYTAEERRFRYLRDEILGPLRYKELMWSMIEAHSLFDVTELEHRLWMNQSHLSQLLSEGHSIGLHSHSHPTRLDELSLEDQAREYKLNFDWIAENLGVKPIFVAHPCGRYSMDTLEILDTLGVKIGFRSTMTEGMKGSLLEIPREDHANVILQMRER